MVPNWRERDDGAWRQVERAIATAPGPRGRHCGRHCGRHLSPRADGSIVSEVPTLPGEAFEFSRARKRPDARGGISLGALMWREVRFQRGVCALAIDRNLRPRLLRELPTSVGLEGRPVLTRESL